MNRAVQGIYEPGSTFKIVTASAAMEERVFSPGDLDRRQRGRLAQRIAAGRRGEEPQLRRAELHRRARQVEQRGRDQDRPDRRGRAARPLRAPVRVRRARCSRRPSRRNARAAVGVGQLEREHAGLGVDGVRDWRDAAADGRGRLGRGQRRLAPAAAPRARAPARRDAHRRRAARGAPRDFPGTAAELVSDHGTGGRAGTAKAAQVPGYTVAGKTGTASKIVGGRVLATDYHASFVGFVPSRRPAFTILVVIDTPHNGQHYGGDRRRPDLPAHRRSGAPPRRRVAERSTPCRPVLVRASAEGAASSELLRTAATGARRRSASWPGRRPCPTSAVSAPARRPAGSRASAWCPA